MGSSSPMISGLSLPAGLSLLPSPTSVAMDMHQTWHTLLLHWEWWPGLVRWSPVVLGGHAQRSRKGFQYLRSFVLLQKNSIHPFCLLVFLVPLFLLYSCLRFPPFSRCPLLKGAKKIDLIKLLFMIDRDALTLRHRGLIEGGNKWCSG